MKIKRLEWCVYKDCQQPEDRREAWDGMNCLSLRNQPCSHIDFRLLNQVLLFWATQFVAIGYSNPRKRIHLHIYSVNCLPHGLLSPRTSFVRFVFPRADTQYVPNIYLLHIHRLSAWYMPDSVQCAFTWLNSSHPHCNLVADTYHYTYFTGRQIKAQRGTVRIPTYQKTCLG